MRRAAELLLAFVALYPVVTAAVWVAGGVLFRLFEERREAHVPDGGWPGVTVLIPAYNEEQVIATSVRAALDADYPELEVLVLDDGSADGTAAAARAAAAGDPRCEVLRDPINRGKAEQLNTGFARARHELVVVTDADTHMLPHALRRLAARIEQSPLVAAVAGAPHVTNRTGLICAMQVLEAASIIGLIRRTQSLSGRVGVVAGVLGMFRRERVLAVGGYDARMSTEDVAGRDAGSIEAGGAVGTADALGARPGRGPSRASAHRRCLAPPPDVDGRPGVGRVAAVGDGLGAGPRRQRPVH
jgi:biofilm PGA synthesis N-glycosyltransferase PgaC